MVSHIPGVGLACCSGVIQVVVVLQPGFAAIVILSTEVVAA